MRKVLLLFAITFAVLSSGAQVVIDGIDYGLGYNMTASINKAIKPIKGDYVVPSTVTYKGKTYKVTSIQYNAYKDCSDISSLKIPYGIIYIGSEAFMNCTGLKKVSFPEGVKEIDMRAFYNCNNLKCVELPNSITEINSDQFSMCSSLVYVSLPSKIKYLFGGFKDCVALTDIYINSSNEIKMSISAFRGTNLDKIRLHAPMSAISYLKNDPSWSTFKSIDSNMTRPHISETTKNISVVSNTLEAIDMGGSVEWANMNLGATSTLQQGDHYAWGEITPKKVFTSRNYVGPPVSEIFNDPHGRLQYGVKYDAARKKLGRPWRLPTRSEFVELIRMCKAILHKKENYVELIAPNGNRLILPVLSYQESQQFIGTKYWTSDVTYSNPECMMYYDPTSFVPNAGDYYLAGFIRPVRNK